MNRLQLIAGTLACSVALFAPPAWTQGAHEAAIGAKFSSVMTLGPRQVPLPPGEWTLIGKDAYQSTGGDGATTALIRVYLAQLYENTRVLKGAVIARTNLAAGGRGGWTRTSDCDRVDMLFNQSDKNYNVHDQECLYINHLTQTLGDNPSKHFKQAFDYMDSQRIRRPTTMVAVIHSLVKGYDFLYAEYNFNPELDGFAPSKTGAWRNNDWHKDNAVSDPKKVAWVEDKKKWAVEWMKQVKAGMDNKLTVAVPKEMKPSPPAQLSAPSAPAAGQAGAGAADRLKQLKELLDRNLITKEEHDARRKGILDGL